MDSTEVIDGQHVIKSNGGKIIEIEIYPNMRLKKEVMLSFQVVSCDKCRYFLIKNM